MAKDFASYHQEVITTVEKITHRVRARVGQSAGDIADIFKHVPRGALLSEVVGDQDHEDFEFCGELVFTEDRFMD